MKQRLNWFGKSNDGVKAMQKSRPISPVPWTKNCSRS